MSEVKLYRADWRHVVQTAEDDAQYVGINDYRNKCHSSDTYYRAWKHIEQDRDAQRLRAETAEADLRIWKDKACEAAERHVAAELRIASAIAYVQRLVNCSKNQDSVATGYLSDILAAINPKPEAGSHE